MALYDTALGALDRDSADVPSRARLIGVPAESPRRLRAVVDEVRPALAPPPALLDDHADAAAAFRIDGLCESGAHNAAWDRVDFAERYRDHLATDPDAQTTVDALRADLAAGDDLALVGPESTDELRSHRTVLRAVLTDEEGGPDADTDRSGGTAD
ncbi:DUF488 family protein, N3 subclade [Halobaculum gomorrense]|uniref:DUF488 domain-containing protein n=1 Tax=Halobaculum gomorrense TaxID=43928 RepID=A0A1M5N0V4_9EURY|nr:DUF488 family protein [Halobaculum gomorrense]SHG83171.1 hypothetical protein SAMN05443636_1221 [Halobaculum gomorrense]